MEFAGKELAGGTVNEAVNGGAEGPTQNCGNGDVIAERNCEKDRATIGKGIREGISDDSTEKAVEVRCIKVVDVANSAGEADWFEGLIGVVEINEVMDAGGVCGCEVFVKRIKAAVEAGAGIEQGSEGDVGGCLGFAESERDGWEGGGDGDGNGSDGRFWEEVECGCARHQLDCWKVGVDSRLLGGSLVRLISCIMFGCFVGVLGGAVRGKGWRRGGDVGGGFGNVGGRGWVYDTVVSVAGHWVAVVVELATFRIVGEKVLEELLASGGIVALGAGCTVSVG